jgi:hypothetical protein
METTTIYNLDDIFYGIEDQNITVWVVDNILTSAVGHKIIYELRDVQTKNMVTIEEPKLQATLQDKKLMVTLDELRAILKEKMDNIITGVEEVKKQFMKDRLKRVLDGKDRKTKINFKKIGEKLKENEIEDVITDSKTLAEKIQEIKNPEKKHMLYKKYFETGGGEL